METRTISTLVKGGHRLANDYIRGRISGIALTMLGGYSANRLIFTNEKLVDANYSTDRRDLIFRHTCTEADYGRFRDQVEYLYPGLCIFDYKG